MAHISDQEVLQNGGVRWILTGDERQHIATLLGVEESTIAHIRGNIMNVCRMTCTKCQKRSGLDDMIHNAIGQGIHNKEFMVDVLVNGPKRSSPEHPLDCSRCSERFEKSCTWHNDEDCGSWW
ncbi:hypothetical protein B0T18DRAFT_487030 [Schizothecium vesticola]|uniref:Uncharacterized protein n=1 Tax=Schizothecium vesticola TaxID=314040 RepID=A0AA40F118_9PEZI|nr:hypothetical protein B0T18DRAFT_487030 [Schizothecium vesticola]